MSIFKVKSNIKHNGREYLKGQEIELEENIAETLLSDGIITDPSENIENEEQETPQPPVNNVTRDGDNVEGGTTIEPGKVEKPQPGDNLDNEDNAPEEKKEGMLNKFFGGNKDETKSAFKVLEGVEYPAGTAHEIGAVIELTEKEASEFAEGLIEKVESGDNVEGNENSGDNL